MVKIEKTTMGVPMPRAPSAEVTFSDHPQDQGAGVTVECTYKPREDGPVFFHACRFHTAWCGRPRAMTRDEYRSYRDACRKGAFLAVARAVAEHRAVTEPWPA